jgi:hypothetical protein
MKNLFKGLARDLGAADPDQLCDQLMLLYDGAMITASMDSDPSGAAKARAMAAGLFEAQTKRRPPKGKKGRASK